MKAIAKQKNVHVSSRKAKLVIDLIRNKDVIKATQILENTNKKIAPIVLKLLHQAISNATNNHAMDSSKLYIYHIVANQAPTLKRTNPRARGSADLLKKRYSHLELVLSDDENERVKDIQLIKNKIKNRAEKNKGYSAKQRKINELKIKHRQMNVVLKNKIATKSKEKNLVLGSK
ncbi:MAG: 50S ribosomal protein L22 [Mycoplasmoidaceae bacterium]